jgi:hypothetical protein
VGKKRAARQEAAKELCATLAVAPIADRDLERPEPKKKEKPEVEKDNWVGELNEMCLKALRRPLVGNDIVWEESGSGTDGWTATVTALGQSGKAGPVEGKKKMARQAAAKELCALLASGKAEAPSTPAPLTEDWISKLGEMCSKAVRRPLRAQDVGWQEFGNASEGWSVEVTAMGMTGKAGPVIGKKRTARQEAAKELCAELAKTAIAEPASGSKGRKAAQKGVPNAKKPGQPKQQQWEEYWDPTRQKRWWWNEENRDVRWEPPTA